MYRYASDETIETWDKQPSKPGKKDIRPGPEGPKYTILNVSLDNYEFTWCVGPGISTIFITKDEFPHDLYILSRGHFP